MPTFVSPGERLRTLRRILGLTGQALANALGVTKTAVSYWESGKTELPKVTCLALSSLYGVSPEWLMQGKGAEWLHKDQRPDLFVIQAWSDGLALGATQDGPRVAFSRSFTEKLALGSGGGSSEDLRILRISDPSMEAVFGPEADVVINTSSACRCQVVDHVLYAVQDGGEGPLVRRLARVPDSNDVLVATANQNQVPARFMIPPQGLDRFLLGRVCWFGRSMT